MALFIYISDKSDRVPLDGERKMTLIKIKDDLIVSCINISIKTN